jgi:hypothetical protein
MYYASSKNINGKEVAGSWHLILSWHQMVIFLTSNREVDEKQCNEDKPQFKLRIYKASSCAIVKRRPPINVVNKKKEYENSID